MTSLVLNTNVLEQEPSTNDFMSPLSYSLSGSSHVMSTASKSSRFTNQHPTPQAPPPPMSTQKSVAMSMMTPMSQPEDLELSRLLSLSGSQSPLGTGVKTTSSVTPRSILSNHSKTTQQQREELQDLLVYIDGIAFATPHPKAPMTGTPARTMSSRKPPRVPGSLTKVVLGDRTNETFVDSARKSTKEVKLPSALKKPSHLSFSSPVPLRSQSRALTARDPTPTRPNLQERTEEAEERFGASVLENPTALWNAQLTSSPAVNDSLIVEVSQCREDPDEDYDDDMQSPKLQFQAQDPPVEQSFAWFSPQRPVRAPAVDPEPTHARRQEVDESIIMASPLADRDLLQQQDYSQMTTHFDQLSYNERLGHILDDDIPDNARDSRLDQSHHQYLPETSFASLGVTPIQPARTPAPPTPMSTLELDTASPAGVDPVGSQSPRSPQDAKEWLQTAVNSLREARSERESARKWAHDMKEAVNKWAEEQRKLIRCETTTRIDALEEREMQIRQQTAALEHLESLVQQLHEAFHATHHERKESEEKLKTLILEQQEKIQDLSRQLESMEQTVCEGMSIQQRWTPKSMSSNPSLPPTEKRHGGSSAFPKFVDQPRPVAGDSSQVSNASSKRTKEPLPNGSGYMIRYSNGVQKEVHKDGTTVIRFANGDVETKFSKSGTLAYFHASEQVLQISTPDGSVLFEYPNAQIERHYPDGTKAILFPNGTKAKIGKDGNVEHYLRI